MFRKLLLMAVVLFFHTGLLAQNSGFIVSDLNSNISGADWEFSFVHLTDLHLGESATNGDFGTYGYWDTLTGFETGYCVTALRQAVNRINTLKDSLKIRFVIITGDLTDSGELSEFLLCKQILDSLEIPYIPLLGNHDIWPYTSSIEAPAPIGDSIFNTVFDQNFLTLQNIFDTWDNGTRLTRTNNPDGDCYTYFQNFSFSYKDYLFLFCDFNSRTHAPSGYLGVGPEAWLFDFPGGSFDWLSQKINAYPDKGIKNILIFAHHPPVKDNFSFLFSFSQSEHNQITSLLCPYRESIGMWCAGHVHLDSVGEIMKWHNPDGVITQGFVTDANKAHTNGYFRVFKAWTPVMPNNSYNTLKEEKDILVFPNPAEKFFNIVAHDQGVFCVEIINSLGKVVFHDIFESTGNNDNGIKINLSTMRSGIYFVKISNIYNNKIVTKKVILQ